MTVWARHPNGGDGPTSALISVGAAGYRAVFTATATAVPV
jgi:hypothetical protein